MIQIDNITDDASQEITVNMDDGTTLAIQLLYLSSSQRWSVNLSHSDSELFTANGIVLTVHPNLLRQWKNIINFGLTCATVDGVDPIDVADFSNGRASLFILNSDDVQTIEDTIAGAS